MLRSMWSSGLLAAFRGGTVGVLKKINKITLVFIIIPYYPLLTVVLLLASGIHSIPHLLCRELTGKKKLFPDHII